MDYSQTASPESTQKTIQALAAHGILAELVPDGASALARLKELIPAGASVSSGASTTLDEIGFTEHLASGAHPWNNLKAAIVAEKDPARQTRLRRESVLADFYLGSVHAVTEDGQVVVASNSGSQLPAYIYTSPNVIWVVGTQKIVPDLDHALARVDGYVIPLEDARMKSTGAPGTALNKLLILKGEPAYLNRSVRLIFVNERLGF